MSVDVQVEVVIDRPVVEVAPFAADPSNAPAWYSNIASVSWQTPPPVSVGSRMDFVAHFLGQTDGADGERAMRRATTNDLGRLKHLLQTRQRG